MSVSVWGARGMGVNGKNNPCPCGADILERQTLNKRVCDIVIRVVKKNKARKACDGGKS